MTSKSPLENLKITLNRPFLTRNKLFCPFNLIIFKPEKSLAQSFNINQSNLVLYSFGSLAMAFFILSIFKCFEYLLYWYAARVNFGKVDYSFPQFLVVFFK